MSYQDTSEQIVAAVRWTQKAAKAIQQAGGDVDTVLNKLPDDVINTFVRNSINLKYTSRI